MPFDHLRRGVPWQRVQVRAFVEALHEADDPPTAFRCQHDVFLDGSDDPQPVAPVAAVEVLVGIRELADGFHLIHVALAVDGGVFGRIVAVSGAIHLLRAPGAFDGVRAFRASGAADRAVVVIVAAVARFDDVSGLQVRHASVVEHAHFVSSLWCSATHASYSRYAVNGTVRTGRNFRRCMQFAHTSVAVFAWSP